MTTEEFIVSVTSDDEEEGEGEERKDEEEAEAKEEEQVEEETEEDKGGEDEKEDGKVHLQTRRHYDGHGNLLSTVRSFRSACALIALIFNTSSDEDADDDEVEGEE